MESTECFKLVRSGQSQFHLEIYCGNYTRRKCQSTRHKAAEKTRKVQQPIWVKKRRENDINCTGQDEMVEHPSWNSIFVNSLPNYTHVMLQVNFIIC